MPRASVAGSRMRSGDGAYLFDPDCGFGQNAVAASISDLGWSSSTCIINHQLPQKDAEGGNLL